MTVLRAHLDTPLGPAQLLCDAAGVVWAFGWSEGDRNLTRRDADVTESDDPFGLASTMAAYFAGHVRAIDQMNVRFAGTSFQNTVWQALRTIPAGETLSYGALAARIESPKAVRAVGLANGANPIAIIVPCHRVIGADGSLTGYGGGLPRKQWLLAHEARHAATGLLAPCY